MFKKLSAIIATGAGFLLGAGAAFAATPVADPTVTANAQDAVLGLQTAATSNLGTVIPVAAVLLISVAIVYFIVRHFRGIAHV